MEQAAESDWELVRGLLAEAHRVRKFHRVVEYEDEPSWTVSLDEETEVELEYDAASHRLFAFCELGAPPLETALAAYSFCLRYNYHVAETGGARLAMLEEDGPISLIHDLTEPELRAGLLPVVLDNLGEVLPVWRDLVAQGLAPAGDDDQPDTLPHPSLRA